MLDDEDDPPPGLMLDDPKVFSWVFSAAYMTRFGLAPACKSR